MGKRIPRLEPLVAELTEALERCLTILNFYEQVNPEDHFAMTKLHVISQEVMSLARAVLVRAKESK